MWRRLIALAAALALSGPVAMAETTHRILPWDDLDGWATDDHGAALEVFLETCTDIDAADWKSLCALGGQMKDNARSFFELFFRPTLIENGEPALFTAYYEPELNGSRVPSTRYRYPIYAMPPEIRPGQVWHSRREIEEKGLLKGRGLEIAYIDDPVDVFFLQVQGSGRVRLADGGALRVGYAGKNGHGYRSVGAELVRRGIYNQHQVSALVIRNWVKRNPVDGPELLRHNPSYVFFREVNEVPAHKGPLGAMNRSITTGRSIAVDPAYTPLGAPVWIEKAGSEPIRRLTVAQDTGSAIKGAQRADIFFGTGPSAGRRAGRIRDPGRMVVLLPIDRALALTTPAS